MSIASDLRLEDAHRRITELTKRVVALEQALVKAFDDAKARDVEDAKTLHLRAPKRG